MVMFRVAFDDLDRFVITVFLFVAFGLMLGAYSRSIVTPGISKANAAFSVKTCSGFPTAPGRKTPSRISRPSRGRSAWLGASVMKPCKAWFTKAASVMVYPSVLARRRSIFSNWFNIFGSMGRNAIKDVCSWIRKPSGVARWLRAVVTFLSVVSVMLKCSAIRSLLCNRLSRARIAASC